jgi:hypothetical protein
MATNFDDPIRLLRQLKGAPLAVLLAFTITRARLSADYLATVTGYTDKPVAQALKLLTAYGWLTKVQGGWMLAAGVQLPLMGEESEKFRPSSSSSSKEVEKSYSEEEEETRKNSDFFRANYRTLKGYGIREPALSELSALEHVTPEFVHAHIRQVHLERGHLGTAIHRIKYNWDAVEILEVAPTVKRYSEGEWSQYFGKGKESEEQ